MPPTIVAPPDIRKFFLALLSDLACDGNFESRFKAAHRELHLFFWKLKQDPEYRHFVEQLLFDTNGNYPHAEHIDELIQEFQLSGVLARPNPTYRYNDIAIKSSPEGEEFKRTLTAEQRVSYDRLFDQFKHELGVPIRRQ